MLAKKETRRSKIKGRIRRKISGSAEKPRLAVYRSNKAIYAQVIDDISGHTITAASSREGGIDKATKIEMAKQTGIAIAKKAAAAGISNITFDRGGYLYHGRVKALAEGAREGGLIF